MFGNLQLSQMFKSRNRSSTNLSVDNSDDEDQVCPLLPRCILLLASRQYELEHADLWKPFLAQLIKQPHKKASLDLVMAKFLQAQKLPESIFISYMLMFISNCISMVSHLLTRMYVHLHATGGWSLVYLRTFYIKKAHCFSHNFRALLLGLTRAHLLSHKVMCNFVNWRKF